VSLKHGFTLSISVVGIVDFKSVSLNLALRTAFIDPISDLQIGIGDRIGDVREWRKPLGDIQKLNADLPQFPIFRYFPEVYRAE
jgi:hypothetical protein